MHEDDDKHIIHIDVSEHVGMIDGSIDVIDENIDVIEGRKVIGRYNEVMIKNDNDVVNRNEDDMIEVHDNMIDKHEYVVDDCNDNMVDDDNIIVNNDNEYFADWLKKNVHRYIDNQNSRSMKRDMNRDIDIMK